MTTIPYKIDSLFDDPLPTRADASPGLRDEPPGSSKAIVENPVADEMSTLEVSDDEAEAVTVAARKERDNQTR